MVIAIYSLFRLAGQELDSTAGIGWNTGYNAVSRNGWGNYDSGVQKEIASDGPSANVERLTMSLDEAQKQKVKAWIEQGLSLSEIQNKLASESAVQMTYMEVRFLIDDLKLKPKDKKRPKSPPAELKSAVKGTAAAPVGQSKDIPATDD